jgi:hypothetical protein
VNTVTTHYSTTLTFRHPDLGEQSVTLLVFGDLQHEAQIPLLLHAWDEFTRGDGGPMVMLSEDGFRVTTSRDGDETRQVLSHRADVESEVAQYGDMPLPALRERVRAEAAVLQDLEDELAKELDGWLKTKPPDAQFWRDRAAFASLPLEERMPFAAAVLAGADVPKDVERTILAVHHGFVLRGQMWVRTHLRSFHKRGRPAD